MITKAEQRVTQYIRDYYRLLPETSPIVKASYEATSPDNGFRYLFIVLVNLTSSGAKHIAFAYDPSQNLVWEVR